MSRACRRSAAKSAAFGSTLGPRSSHPHKGSARSVGIIHSPTMSRAFSTKSGSFDSLVVSCRRRFSRKARQMRCTELVDTPTAALICRVAKSVELSGLFLTDSDDHSLNLLIAHPTTNPGARFISQFQSLEMTQSASTTCRWLELSSPKAWRTRSWIHPPPAPTQSEFKPLVGRHRALLEPWREISSLSVSQF